MYIPQAASARVHEASQSQVWDIILSLCCAVLLKTTCQHYLAAPCVRSTRLLRGVQQQLTRGCRKCLRDRQSSTPAKLYCEQLINTPRKHVLFFRS
jgi:hypothetical protein